MDDDLQLKEYLEKYSKDLFCELKEEINDDNVTDIEWDGYNLWITDLTQGSFLSKKKLKDVYVDNLAIKLANIMKVPFNRSVPVLEANTDSLRISIWHESRCTKKSVAIRKIPLSIRFDHNSLINSRYCPETIISLLENCVKAHMNCVIGGQPHAGKTELLKYLSTFIPAYEKVGVYEDNQEIHYRYINPGKKCVEFFVDNKFSYSQILKAGLRHNIDWMLLSESRGEEVVDLMNSLSTGAYCMTTMHLDSVRSIPDRMYNMLGVSSVAECFINSIYKYIDVGVLVECDSKERRTIREIAFFSREEGVNSCTVIYENAEFTMQDIPADIMARFCKYGISNPYEQNVEGLGEN